MLSLDKKTVPAQDANLANQETSSLLENTISSTRGNLSAIEELELQANALRANKIAPSLNTSVTEISTRPSETLSTTSSLGLLDTSFKKEISANTELTTATAPPKEKTVANKPIFTKEKVSFPSPLKDPLGFLAAIIKYLEQSLLGTLYELNSTPNVASVKINLKTKEEELVELEEKLEQDLKAKNYAERGVASDGSVLFNHKISRADDNNS